MLSLVSIRGHISSQLLKHESSNLSYVKLLIPTKMVRPSLKLAFLVSKSTPLSPPQRIGALLVSNAQLVRLSVRSPFYVSKYNNVFIESCQDQEETRRKSKYQKYKLNFIKLMHL